MDRSTFTPADAVEWFRNRSYEYTQFSDLAELGRRKQERDLTVSLVLPCRNVADTVGGIIDEIHAVNEQAQLVDQILAVDADSEDGTAKVPQTTAPGSTRRAP